jgi:hypothetical protein
MTIDTCPMCRTNEILLGRIRADPWFSECRTCGWIGSGGRDRHAEEQASLAMDIVRLGGSVEARPFGGDSAGWSVTATLHDSRISETPSVTAFDRSRVEAYRLALAEFRGLAARTEAEIAARPVSMTSRLWTRLGR